MTQRSSDAGYTLLDTDGIDFDGITGIHGISIDTSDNTDAGFWAAGNDYWVIISSVTVDAATINFIAATFSIDNRGLLRPTTAQRTLDVTATGAAGIDWGNIENPTTVVDLSGTDINLVDTTTTNTDMRGTDSAALASELAKVPKSDGTTSWNATALAAINAECDTALTDYDAVVPADLPTNFADLSITATTGLVDITQAAADKAWGTATRALTDKAGFTISGTKTTLDALNDITAASVWSVSLTELSADPGASPAASGAVLLPYMAIRNKRDTTATSDEIHNNAGTVVLTATISDDGTTFSKTKYA